MIENALIRLELIKGDLPYPFEKPSELHNFWILELPHSSFEEIINTIQIQKDLILAQVANIRHAVLYLAFDPELEAVKKVM